MDVADNNKKQETVVSQVQKLPKLAAENGSIGLAPRNNYCTVCFVALGPSNPRQLCRKTYCENADFVFDFSDDS